MSTGETAQAPARLRLRAATRATYVAFIGCGFAFASWASRIPQVRDRLHLSSADLGLVLLAIACGSIAALLLAGIIVSRFHSRRTVAVMAALQGAALAAVAAGYLVGVAPVVVGLFVFGFSAGAWDVAMNVQGAGVERRLGRAIMPRFHAGYSIGTVAGALVGAAMVALHAPVTAHLLAVAVIEAVVIPAAVRSFIPDTGSANAEPGAADGGGTASALRRWREPRTLLVGIVVLAFAFAEGAGIDWISLSLIDGYQQPAVLGTIGFAAFLAAMTAGRWFADHLLARYGRVTVIRGQTVLAIAGVLLFVFSPTTPLAFAGVILWGVGASLGFPVGMSAAADDPAAAAGRVSVVASIGYCAFLGGPPLIGYLGQNVTVLRALVAVAVVLALAALLTGSLRPLPAALSPSPTPSADPPRPRRDNRISCAESGVMAVTEPDQQTERQVSSGDDPAAIRARVDELMNQMTPAEKAGQLTQYFYFRLPAAADTEPALGVNLDAQSRMVEEALGRGEAGSLLFVTDPGAINRLQRLALAGNRLGIPLLFGFDVIHGLRTIFPVPIAMAASWDLETIERGQSVAAREARAVGIHWAFAPMVDIARDPRWGRIIEGAGEDPFLGAAVAAAQVRGFQGADFAQPERIIAGPKHFAGYGAAIGGRDYDEVNLSEYELWNSYFPPFQAAVEAGAGNVMTAYMDLNGVPASGSRWLFTEVLRGTWGFGGFVVSDANAVRNLVTHGFAADLTDAAARAVTAGVDMEMAIADPAYAHLPEALQSGAVTGDVIDARVRKILEAKLRLGLFDAPYVDEDRAREVLADPEHREVARVAAERSAVLLRNEGSLLPLAVDQLSSIAVIGPLAASQRDTLGPWVFDFDLDETVTVLDGIRRTVGDNVRVDYAPGVRVVQRVFPSMFDMFGGNRPADPEGFDEDAGFAGAVKVAAAADVAAVVVGEWQNMIGEAASRSSIELPGRQLELLQAVVDTGTPTVLLVMNGRPLDLRWAAENVPAILDIWYPGTQGGAAVANLLFGIASPGGKLPFSWPRTVGQVPMTYSHTRSHDPDNQARRYWDEASTPLFPFGYGLSYGQFAYSDLTIDPPAIPHDGTVTVSVQVSNTSEREAAEVVQLYLHQRHGSASRPVRELKGFRRVVLPGQTSRQVRFTIGPDHRRYWSTTARDWVLDSSVFDLWVGRDSTAELTGTFEVSRA